MVSGADATAKRWTALAKAVTDEAVFRQLEHGVWVDLVRTPIHQGLWSMTVRNRPPTSDSAQAP